MQNIKVVDDTTIRLETDLRANVNTVKDYKQYSAASQRKVIEKEKALAELSNSSINYFLNNKKVPEHFRRVCRASLCNERSTLRSLVGNEKDNVRYYNDNIPRYERAVTSLEKKLANQLKISPNRTLNINDVKIALADFPNVDEDRCSFKVVGSIPFLTVYVHDVICTPSRIRYINIKDKNWKLPPMKIVFNLSTGQCKVTLDTSLGDYQLPKAWTIGKPHPHIMRADSPCYGDFLGAAIDAKNDLDVAQMVTIMLLFLEQANVVDEAGGYYPRFMMFAADQTNLKQQKYYSSCYSKHVGNYRFYGHAGTSIKDGHSDVYFIPVVEDGKVEFHEVPNRKSVYVTDFLKDLKLPKEKRTIATLGYEYPLVEKKVPIKKKTAKKVSIQDILGSGPTAILDDDTIAF